jgi:hypothetical protein
LSLAKFKRENKNYLNYLLFQSSNKEDFLKNVKAEIDSEISTASNYNNLYSIRKNLQKVLRRISVYNKYLQSNQYALELYIFFCKMIIENKIPFFGIRRIDNLFLAQIKKINRLNATLHPDLQADYKNEIEEITLYYNQKTTIY